MQTKNQLLKLILFIVINSNLTVRATDPIDDITKELTQLIQALNTTNIEINSSQQIIAAIFSTNWELTNKIIDERTSYSYLVKATLVISFCAFTSYQLFKLIKYSLINCYRKNKRSDNRPRDDDTPLLEAL